MNRGALPGDSTPVEELIERARSGDEGALEKLFRRCRPQIDRLAAQRLERKQPGLMRPSDIAQETALRAFKSFSKFEGTTEGEWLSWLRSILDTTVTQSFRDASRQKRDARGAVPLDSPEAALVPAADRSPSHAASLAEAWQTMYTHIFQLPPEQREAIWLCHLKELPVADVAKRMGKTDAAVAGLLRRGLLALKAGMTEGSGEAPPGHHHPASSDDAALALLVYLRRRDAGERVDADAFVAEHAGCADELRTLLDWVARIHAVRPTDLGD